MLPEMETGIPLSSDSILRILRNGDTEVLYGSALELQTRLNTTAIKDFLNTQNAWAQASHILDAGCGPGEFAAQMKDVIGEKLYLGIDLEQKFISAAVKKMARLPNFTFKQADILNFQEGAYDLILLYAVLQHMPSVPETLKGLRKLLKAGGSIFVYDASGAMGDSEFISSPAIPTAEKMYADLQNASLKKSRNVDCLLETIAWADSLGWSATRFKMVSEVKSPEQKEKQVWYVMLVSELLSRFYQVKTDQKKLFEELVFWKDQENASAQLGGGEWIVVKGQR